MNLSGKTLTETLSETLKFKVIDALLLLMAILPLVACIALKVLFTPAGEGISIAGALVFFTVPMPLQNLPITESQVNSLAVMISIFALCLYFTHGLSVKCKLKRQVIAELIVEKANSLTINNMGEYFKGFAPFIAGKYVTQATRFKTAELKKAVRQCVEAEEAVKSGRMNDMMSVEILIVSEP